MEDTAATIERLTAERDALARALARLTMAVQAPRVMARERLSPADVTRYLTTAGWHRVVDGLWEAGTGMRHGSVDTVDVVTAVRDLALIERRPEALVVADLLEHADAAR